MGAMMDNLEQDRDEWRREAMRWKENHKTVVATKRGVDARLKTALAALQQIYDVCKDNAPESCNQRMALAFVGEVAGDAFEKVTTNVRGLGRMAPVPSGERG
jgi:hypothetical protein